MKTEKTRTVHSKPCVIFFNSSCLCEEWQESLTVLREMIAIGFINQTVNNKIQYLLIRKTESLFQFFYLLAIMRLVLWLSAYLQAAARFRPSRGNGNLFTVPMPPIYL